ncbi:MAG: AzlC family ABC transporter permease [Rhizobiales bacterium]|nr:AzlC family ABC transporter permease [Hyphomicrobiales bacterium]
MATQSPVAPPLAPPKSPRPFVAGLRTALTSVFSLVLFGTYLGIGALAHDFGFSVHWIVAATLLVWAGPAQVILVSALGAGAAPFEVAIAVSLSSLRLLPMVVSLLPVIREPGSPAWRLLMPAHFTAVSMWVETMRIAPNMPRALRVAFCNGVGAGFMFSACVASVAGFYLAAKLPSLLTAGLLFLTPIAFLISVTRNAKWLVDRLALALGLVIAPVLVVFDVGLDILWTGILGGTIAYAAHRWREGMA